MSEPRKLVTMVAKSGTFDRYRGVSFDRGVWITAPPGFFEFYGGSADFEPPKEPRKSTDVILRDFESWTRPEDAPPSQPQTAAPEADANYPPTGNAPPIVVKKKRGRPPKNPLKQTE